jgi:ribonuclease HII
MVTRTTLGAADRTILREASAVVGVDEVGRGCLAGPVVIGAARFVRIPHNPLVQDSKSLTKRQRAEVRRWVVDNSDDWLVVEIWPEVIDRVNILGAVRLAMRSAVETLARPGSVAVVDHVELGPMDVPTVSRPKADATYFCVAGASVIAKEHRDRLMADLAAEHGHWAWENNVGYGTPAHRSALQKHGRSYLHRKSFGWSPVLP